MPNVFNVRKVVKQLIWTRVNTNSLIYLGKLSTLLVGDVPGFADTLLHALRESMNTGKEEVTLGRVVIHFDLKERYHTRMMSVSFERSI
jgi:hypothetical protein